MRLADDSAWIGWLVGFVLLLAVFIFLASISNILTEATQLDPAVRRFSLARVQMAIWFFVVSGAYTTVFVLTGSTPDLQANVLVLVGISSTTYLAATALRSGDDSKARVDALQAVTTRSDDEEAELTRLQKRGKRLGPESPKGVAGKVKRFLLELVSDEEGVTLHRFQMLSWTLIFVVIFVMKNVATLTLPDLGGTALGLMGISSGTYIGFKVPTS